MIMEQIDVEAPTNNVIEDVKRRFYILVGEVACGNTSPEIKTELYNTLDILYKNGNITETRHDKILRAFF